MPASTAALEGHPAEGDLAGCWQVKGMEWCCHCHCWFQWKQRMWMPLSMWMGTRMLLSMHPAKRPVEGRPAVGHPAERDPRKLISFFSVFLIVVKDFIFLSSSLEGCSLFHSLSATAMALSTSFSAKTATALSVLLFLHFCWILILLFLLVFCWSFKGCCFLLPPCCCLCPEEGHLATKHPAEGPLLFCYFQKGPMPTMTTTTSPPKGIPWLLSACWNCFFATLFLNNGRAFIISLLTSSEVVISMQMPLLMQTPLYMIHQRFLLFCCCCLCW